jgi:hypothetical protein
MRKETVNLDWKIVRLIQIAKNIKIVEDQM